MNVIETDLNIIWSKLSFVFKTPTSSHNISRHLPPESLHHVSRTFSKHKHENIDQMFARERSDSLKIMN